MEQVSMGVFLWLVDLVNIGTFQELADFLNTQDQTVRNVMSIIGVVVCIVGLLQCFLGYKLFRVWCGFVGFLIGTLLAIALSTSGILHGSPAADLISLLLIIFLGMTGAMIAYKAYLIGVFIYGFHAVFYLGFFPVALVSGSLLAGLVAGILAGTAMGVLAVIYRRFWIILLTSISGGISVCAGLMMIMQSTNISYAFILPPVLAAAGFFVQYISDKKEVESIAKSAAAKTPPADGKTGPSTEAAPAEPEAQPQESPTVAEADPAAEPAPAAEEAAPPQEEPAAPADQADDA